MRLLFCFCAYFVTLHSNFSQIDTIVLSNNLNDFEWQQPLLGHASIADRVPKDEAFNQIKKREMSPYLIDSVFIKDDKCAWLHFSIKNPNLTDSAHFFINFNNRIHYVTLFSEKNGLMDSVAGGRLTDYYKRPFLKNKACFPISLPPQYSGTFWLKFNNFSENRNNLYPQLVSKTTEVKQRWEIKNSAYINQFIEVIYLSLFALLALVAARLGYIWLDKGYTWYAIYIASLFIFYFRDFENYNNNHVVFFSYFSSWHFEIEATMCYFTYMSYMIFIQKFLDLKQFYPRLNSLLSIAIRLIIACLFLDLCIHAIWGLAVSFRIFITIRLVFFVFYFVILIIIGFTTASALSRFIVIGTIFMLIPGLTSNIAMALGGDTKVFYHGLFWLYDFKIFKLPMFNSRIGLILEACFFLYGLSWKARREYDELKKLKLNHTIVLQNLDKSTVTPLLSIDPQMSVETPLETPEVQTDSRIAEAFEHLEKNFNDPNFTVKKWSQLVFLSPSHFSKLFVEHTQEAPSIHIQRFRLQQAQKLMCTTDFTLAQIALDCGYNDSNYFSRIFKKTFSLTPSEWQNIHKKG